MHNKDDIPRPASRKKRPLHILRNFSDWRHQWLVNGQPPDYEHYFRSLAVKLSELFNAKLVTVWDNNVYTNCAVWLGDSFSDDTRKSTSIPEVTSIPIDNSFTGVTIVTNSIQYFHDLNIPLKNRIFQCAYLLNKHEISKMVSVPVSLPSQPQYVKFVINMYFDEDSSIELSVAEKDILRLTKDIGSDLDLFINSQKNEIQKAVLAEATFSEGISSYFDKTLVMLKHIFPLETSTLLLWDNKYKDYIVERSTKDEYIAGIVLDDFLKKNMVIDRRSINICRSEDQPVLLNLTETSASCHNALIISPIQSAPNRPLGLLICEKQRKNPPIVMFSSLDIESIYIFSKAIQPIIERFHRSREGTIAINLIKDISSEMVHSFQMNKNLNTSIEIIVKKLRARIGSIYLIDETNSKLVMCAAYGPNTTLIGNAEYKLDEGITGAILKEEIINLRNNNEITQHPAYKGKYDDVIYNDSCQERKNFLGIRIVFGKKVIGALKIANLTKGDDHPDDYFTDEDINVALILTHFLAFSIEYNRAESTRLKQFNQLAEIATKLQKSENEQEVITSMLLALSEAEFNGAIISTINNQTQKVCISEGYGDIWNLFKYEANCSLEDMNDVRAVILSENKPQEWSLPSYKQDFIKISRNRISGSQYIVPLRMKDEHVGTLHINTADELSDEIKLILEAFSILLTNALLWCRKYEDSLNLSDFIMTNSRFITVEALSGFAVHSVGHRLRDITRKLQRDIETKEIKENKYLLDTLKSWNADISRVGNELNEALQWVRAPGKDGEKDYLELHHELRSIVNIWYSYLRNNKCSIKYDLLADNTKCYIAPAAIREIISVLIVNSVQAHSKTIKLRTYNEHNVKIEKDIIKNAISIEILDDGKGLELKDDELCRIFESTYTTKHEKFGTGLGLFIAKQLVRSCSGDIIVNPNNSTKGATFKLILPI